MKNKIIFLDIDGVLTDKYCSYFTDNYSFLTEKVEMIKGLLERTGAKIVWSTNWRNHPENECIIGGKVVYSNFPKIAEVFKKYTIGCAPHEHGNKKEADIRKWLYEHMYLWDDFVVIDDQGNQDLDKFGENFFQTNFDTGITEMDIARIEEYLKED